MRTLYLSTAVLVSMMMTSCSSTKSMYAKYDDNCDVPKLKIVEKPVEKIKYVDRIKYKTRIVEKPIEKIKYVDRIKYKTQIVEKPVEKIKYVDRVQYKTKVVKKYISTAMKGDVWSPAVYFSYDQSRLSERSIREILNNINVLNKYPNLNVSIQGFTDQRGSNQYNKRLAANRVRSVKQYLVSKGISPSRIRVSPIGELSPKQTNKNIRSANRRVELMLLDQSGRPIGMKVLPILK